MTQLEQNILNGLQQLNNEAWRMNEFQRWATEQLERSGYSVALVGNWVRVNDELDLMSYQGVAGYIDARRI